MLKSCGQPRQTNFFFYVYLLHLTGDDISEIYLTAITNKSC